jgi:DNA-binding beta-propeller fold protein YncE
MPFGIRTRALTTTTLVLSLLFALPSARAGEKPKLLYLDVDTGGSYPSLLVATNLDTKKAGGEFSVGVIGSTTPFPSSIALAICPSKGEDGPGAVAYTIANAFSPQNQLATLDLRTGAATLIGSPLVQEFDMMAMTCSPDGTLYAIGELDSTNANFNSLYTVDRETGAATLVGPTGVRNDQAAPPSFSGYFMALSFAPDGTLYGVSDGGTGTEKGNALYKLSLTNGVATNPVHINVDAVMGLAIDEDGRFYVADYVRQSKVYKLDSGTGMATPILETHLDFVNNIAFKQPKSHDD